MFCKKCQSFWNDVTSQVQFDTSSVRWSEYSATIIHNDFGSLMRSSNQGCPPCRAIVHAVTRKGCTDVPADTTVLFELDPQDGLQPVLRGELRTPQGHSIVRKFIIAVFSDLVDDNLPSALSKCQTLENQSTGSDAAIELARFWVNECLTKHQNCGLSSSSLSFVPTRVLDLANGGIRLIATNEIDMADRRYLTLSHCWGKARMITTTKATLNERRRGIRMSDLSRTFQDSVQAARKLGFRYLWIDSLCIVQDDPQDWEREAAQMCQVYSHSALNIAASHASDGLMGCFVQRDGLLQLPFSVKLRRGMSALFTLYDLSRIMPALNGRSQQPGGELGPPLFGRAWVFQEQMLSQRMLVFDSSGMSWECLCGRGTERYPVTQTSPHTTFHKSIRNRITEDEEFFKDDDFSRQIQHSEWCDAVMDYTHRGMTYSSDRLIAITGIADAIQRKTRNEFIVGLWKSELWLGLLWSIPQSVEYTSTTSRAFDYRATPFRDLKNAVAPSWSWVSVTRPVVYPNAIRNYVMRQICDIGRVEISGPPSTKTGVMELRGHTRTAYVNSIYPYAFGKDPDCPADMVFPYPDVGEQEFDYRGRRFHPNNYFIFSDQRPTRHGGTDWQLMRGLWRPDEVVPPDIPITFLAIAQQNHRRNARQHRHNDPLQVFTIALVPTGEPGNKYRRVGYAVWDDCAWYGYRCNQDTRFAPSKGDFEPAKPSLWRRILELVCCWTSDLDEQPAEQPSEKSSGLIEEAYPTQDGFHNHAFDDGRLPERSSYHDRVNVRTMTLQVV